MSIIDFRSKRTDPNNANKRIREIIKKHKSNIVFSSHAKDEMKKDNLNMNDILNVLCSPDSRIIHEGELKNDSYRYKYGTNRIVVVVAFWPNGKGFNVVTAWRK